MLDKGWNGLNPILNCDGCGSCTLESSLKTPCCGCTCLSCKYGFYPDYRPGGESDKPGLDLGGIFRRELTVVGGNSLNNSTTDTSSEQLVDIIEAHRLMERADPTKKPSSSTMPINFCGGMQARFSYPAYPNFLRFPNSQVRFDTQSDAAPIMK